MDYLNSFSNHKPERNVYNYKDKCILSTLLVVYRDSFTAVRGSMNHDGEEVGKEKQMGKGYNGPDYDV